MLGSSSAYMKFTIALKTTGSTSSTTTVCRPGFPIGPKNWALDTGERAARTHLCVRTFSSPTSKIMSQPTPCLRSSLKQRPKSDGGT
uniref:Uncharacterized protein n=1 Tax=Arundo donax TaxID=35708 RepID=A0A0A9H2K0_ARUDO